MPRACNRLDALRQQRHARVLARSDPRARCLAAPGTATLPDAFPALILVVTTAVATRRIGFVRGQRARCSCLGGSVLAEESAAVSSLFGAAAGHRPSVAPFDR